MNMDPGVEIINTKQLREGMPHILKRIREGKRFLVLHRSRPAFELSPPGQEPVSLPPLASDPLFEMAALGRTEDGADAAGHDASLYPR